MKMYKMTDQTEVSNDFQHKAGKNLGGDLSNSERALRLERPHNIFARTPKDIQRYQDKLPASFNIVVQGEI